MIAQIVTTGLGVLIPRLVLVNLGSESNGLLSSVGSVLSYMSLLEAGVGLATQQALYAPFGKNDHDAINRIMAATHFFYKRTGYIYLALVSILSVGYTLLIETSLPKIQVFFVIFLSGLSGVLSYFFQGKYRIFLAAEGKSYITTNITTIVGVGVSLCKAGILLMGGNVLAVQLSHFLWNFVQMLGIVLYIRRHYPWLDLKVKADFDAISQKKAVLVHQISGLIFSNTDTVLLTIFTSLKVVSVYGMYAMIFGMVKSIAVTVSEGFHYALGQAFQDRKRFMPMFDTYETYNMAFTASVFCIAKILMTPFLKLYTAGVTDISYIDPYLPWLFAIFYLLHNGRASSSSVIDFAQEFENTKWHAVLEAAINLTVSIVLTIKLGIYGVLLGTIAALLYRTNDMIIYAAKLLKRSPWITYRRWITDLVLFLICDFIGTRIPVDLSNYFNMVLYGVALSITIIPLFLGVNSLLEPKSAKYAWNVAKNFLSNKLHRKEA